MGHWHNGLYHGGTHWGFWLLGLLTIVFIASLVVLLVNLGRRPLPMHDPAARGAWPGGHHHAPPPPPVVAPRPTPEEILAERLARGEIDPDDYRARVAALRQPPSA